MMRKITLLLLLTGAFTLVVRAQENEYYLGHSTLSLQASAFLFGLQTNYQYIVNPKARFMWLGRAGIGMSLYEAAYGNYRIYYNAGIDGAYGGIHRAVLGVNYYYNAGMDDYQTLAGDIGYMFVGRGRVFVLVKFRVWYEPECDCGDVIPLSNDYLLSVGLKL